MGNPNSDGELLLPSAAAVCLNLLNMFNDSQTLLPRAPSTGDALEDILRIQNEQHTAFAYVRDMRLPVAGASLQRIACTTDILERS